MMPGRPSLPQAMSVMIMHRWLVMSCRESGVMSIATGVS